MSPSAEARIRHSIIVPTFGRPDLLERCLEALRAAEPPTWDWEAIVVDNGLHEHAHANTAVVESFSDPRFRYVKMESRGLTAARHLGANLAQGDVLSLLDDDSFVLPTWLVGVERAFSDADVVLVGGPNVPLFETAPPDWLDYFWATMDGVRFLTYLSILDGGESVRTMPTTLVFGCNASIRKQTFFESGGVHPDAMPPELKKHRGDGETGLCVRVAALGHDALYSPGCAIRHLVPSSRMTPEYFRRRAFDFGVEASFTELRREHGLGPRQGVPERPASEAGLSVGALWDKVHRRLGVVRGRLRSTLGNATQSGSGGQPEASQIRAATESSSRDGWQFHRREVEASPELLRYVLSPDFLDERVWDVLGPERA